MMLAAVFLMAAVSLEAKPASTSVEQLAKLLVNGGEWQFRSRRLREDGRAECVEGWRFLADGTSFVQSGDEEVTQTWTIENSSDGYLYLSTLRQSSTGGIDCTGSKNEPSGVATEPFAFAVITDGRTGLLHMCMWPGIIARNNPMFTDLGKETACFGSITSKTPSR